MRRATFKLESFVVVALHDPDALRNGLPMPYVSHADAERFCNNFPESYQWNDAKETITALGGEEEIEVHPEWITHDPYVDEEGEEVDGGNYFPISFCLPWEVVKAKYTVHARRTTVEVITFEVEADSEADAWERADDALERGDHGGTWEEDDPHRPDGNGEVTDIEPIDEESP